MEREIRPKIEATESELQAEYERLKATEFTKAPTVTLQEILVKEDAEGSPSPARSWRRRGPARTSPRSPRAYSAAPSRAHGGEVGQLSQGELNPELEKVAFGLPVGSVSDPLPVEGGYRILKVTAKTSGSVTPYDAAKDKVRDRLMMARFEKAYDAYMEELRKNASVELRVREVPLQLTGPIPEGSLLEALEPLAPGARPPARRRPLPRRPGPPIRSSSRPSRTPGAPRPPTTRSPRLRRRPRRRWRPRRRPPSHAPKDPSRPVDESGRRPLLRARLRPRPTRSPGGGSPPTARSRSCWASPVARVPWAGRCGRSPRRKPPASPGTASSGPVGASRPEAAPGPQVQRRRLRTEGVRFRGAVVDMARHGVLSA